MCFARLAIVGSTACYLQRQMDYETYNQLASSYRTTTLAVNASSGMASAATAAAMDDADMMDIADAANTQQQQHSTPTATTPTSTTPIHLQPNVILSSNEGVEFSFVLYRHWSLYESMLNDPLLSASLALWTEQGRKNLATIFLKIGKC